VTERYETERIITEQQAKLAASSKMAALGEMAASLAHEINNPLAIIDGKLQLLARLLREDKMTTASALSIIESAAATTERIAKIVRSMHSFGRDVATDPFELASLREIIDGTTSFCGERFKNHDIDLGVSSVPDVRIECRPVEISQVLLNLLNNAYDAVLDEHDRQVRIVVAERPEGVEIAVEDSGRGIAPEHRAKLFQPFFTTKEIGRGTGLGLSVSRGIATAHGGELYLAAGAQRTRFVLRLPLKQADVTRH
jgi:C4-dicarboxylate-specific signal transduction histidine kinase